jgi:hypothetical protein
LGVEEPFDMLFAAPPYSSLDEALRRPQAEQRRRAPRAK